MCTFMQGTDVLQRCAGNVLCGVVVSDEEIGSPYPDYLESCCMNEDAYDKYALIRNWWVIINRSVKEEMTKCGGEPVDMQ